jgi:hypothetical protein
LPLPAATLLGATLADRLRVNATWARRGMYATAAAQEGELPEFVGGLQSRLKRWRLAARVGALRLMFWLASLMHGVTATVLPPLA